MHKKSLLSESKFWNVVDTVLDINVKKPLSDILSELEINRFEFNCFFTFFKDLGVNINLELLDEVTYVVINADKKINFEMSIGQWLKFQAHFPVIENLKLEPYSEEITNLISKTEKNNQNDLFYSVQNLEQILTESKELSLCDSLKKKHISLIEECIVNSTTIEMYIDEKLVSIAPHRLMSISKKLNLVYEIEDQNLLDIIEVDEVTSMAMTSKNSTFAFNNTEVENFIKNVRDLDTHEERLVLKVKEFHNFNRDLKNEFFRNEVLVQSYGGDHIWAASVEINDSVLNWIFDQGKSIEIISSEYIKKEYLNFCQRKLKQLA